MQQQAAQQEQAVQRAVQQAAQQHQAVQEQQVGQQQQAVQQQQAMAQQAQQQEPQEGSPKCTMESNPQGATPGRAGLRAAAFGNLQKQATTMQQRQVSVGSIRSLFEPHLFWAGLRSKLGGWAGS